MNDDLKSGLTEDDLAELGVALNEMSDTEQRILARLLELHPLEEVLELVAVMSEENGITEYRFADPDPYTTGVPVFSERCNRSYRICEDGRIQVKNLSAYWIPKLTITEIVAGTIYTVTGSYDGADSFLRKLERVTAKSFSQKLEDFE